MTTDVWAATETDGGRLVQRRAREHAGQLARIASDLKALANVSDADRARPRLIEAHATADRLQKQLESLGQE